MPGPRDFSRHAAAPQRARDFRSLGSSNQRANDAPPLHRITPGELTRRLAVWSGGAQVPLYLQLANRLTALIERGELSSGTVMPSERELASALSVSRRTITAAYDQLRSLGKVMSQTGVGTWCAPSRAQHERLHLATHVQHLSNSPADMLDLTIGSPFGHPLVLTAREQVAPQLDALLRRGHGYQPAGIDELRVEICGWFAQRGVPTEPDQVVITSGAAQALWLVAASLAAGTSVAVEDPTSPTILAAVRSHDLRARAVPTDSRGLIVEELRHDPPGAVFVSPSYLNPTGAHLAAGRCRELAGLAARGGTLVIEDLVLSDIRLDGPSPRTVAALAPSSAVVSIGSMSKLCWGGLRIGWLRGPRQVVSRVLHHKGAMDLGVSPDLQLQATWLLRHHDDIIADRIPRLRQARDALAQALARWLPHWRWDLPEGGLSFWAELPDAETGPLLQQAQRRGVAILPGSAFSLTDQETRRLRLPYVHPPADYDIIAKRLAGCFPMA